MNLQQLRYFHKIAALKNYTKASEELFVAQSSLSHSMAKLEHELGVPLFIKQGRNIVVTSYGENFDKHVAIILRELELAKTKFNKHLINLKELLDSLSLTPCTTIFFPA